jgi:Zn-dependent protease
LANFDIANFIIWFVVLIFSLSFHEAAHAWTSEKFGDSTGRYQGRITLNPRAHIDPIGTILIPIINYFTGFPLLGWAKPVQTNPRMWRDKRKANILVSAAGPVSNLILASASFFIIKVLMIGGVVGVGGHSIYQIVIPKALESSFMTPLSVLLSVILILNVALCVFNLLPIPPLDGSHVLEEFLPYEAARIYEQLRPYGFLVLMAFLLFGVLGFIFSPIYKLIFGMLSFGQ